MFDLYFKLGLAAALLAGMSAGVWGGYRHVYSKGFDAAKVECAEAQKKALEIAMKEAETKVKAIVKVNTVYRDAVATLPALREKLLNEVRQDAPKTDTTNCDLDAIRVCRINAAAGYPCADTGKLDGALPNPAEVRGKDPK